MNYPIADVVLQHHERLNGSGYPGGLDADQILPDAKILAVADVFEAMVSHRPYRPALSYEAAISELQTNSGILYDSSVVDALVHLVNEEKLGILN
jgi:HD-GYP domain-containing protein (c-di-GMP phosphodiesterase class II)